MNCIRFRVSTEPEVSNTLLLQNPFFMVPDQTVSQIQKLHTEIFNMETQASCVMHLINGENDFKLTQLPFSLRFSLHLFFLKCFPVWLRLLLGYVYFDYHFYGLLCTSWDRNFNLNQTTWWNNETCKKTNKERRRERERCCWRVSQSPTVCQPAFILSDRFWFNRGLSGTSEFDWQVIGAIRWFHLQAKLFWVGGLYLYNGEIEHGW